MQPYLSHHAILTKEKENIFLTLMIQEQKVITGLQVIGETRKAITSFERQVDEESEIRYEIFQLPQLFTLIDRKSTRLNSSHVAISYAVFCLTKKYDKID